MADKAQPEMVLKGFKAMAAYLKEHADLNVHHDVLRKAVDDAANPLPVAWDNGFAEIYPQQLMAWRMRRRGVRTRRPEAGSKVA